MEFNEKLQKLRKQRGMTQEELAEVLFVSRTAISKWESGRGYPNIDSLKAISGFFSVTIDELLSGEEALTIAEEENKQNESHFRDLMFGLLDVSSAMLFLLPVFGQYAGGGILSVSLFALTGIQLYLKAGYFAAVLAMVMVGVAMLALQNCSRMIWVRNKQGLSLLVSAAGAFLFIVARQPYAAVYIFVCLMIKAWIWKKR